MVMSGQLSAILATLFQDKAPLGSSPISCVHLFTRHRNVDLKSVQKKSFLLSLTI